MIVLSYTHRSLSNKKKIDEFNMLISLDVSSFFTNILMDLAIKSITKNGSILNITFLFLLMNSYQSSNLYYLRRILFSTTLSNKCLTLQRIYRCLLLLQNLVLQELENNTLNMINLNHFIDTLTI